MRLGWIINRLRNMGPAEILHRLNEKARQIGSRRRHHGWALFAAPATLPALPGLRDAILRADPAQRTAIAAATAGVLAGRFSALGRDWPHRDPADLFPPALWQLDPVTGKQWPGAETYCFDIEFRHDGSRGDIKYVWEINRLQFLQPLAAAALLDADAAALAAIDAAILSWHGANPPFCGTGWASGIEVALRAISLLFAMSLVGDRLRAETRQAITEILAASAFWLHRFPSRHSSANNHRVAELAGLYLIGLTGGTEPAPIRAELLAEIDRQILPDGAGAEQTPTYAAFTIELALLCAAAAKAAGVPFPATFDSRIAAFGTFIAWLAGTGETPALGDDDEGRVLTLLGHEADYPRAIAAAVAGFLGTAGPAAEPAELRALVFGQPIGIAPAPRGLMTFPAGGVSVWHGSDGGRDLSLVADHGPLGYLSIAAHGHADALSFTLAIDGAPVLVDPGTWLYGSGGAWRDWFRGTPAHNTLNLEGQNQSIVAGAFNWSAKAKAQLAEASRTRHFWLRMHHDGYRGRFGVTHQRTIERRPEGFAITDQLLGGRREAEIVFQLAPGLTTEQDGRRVMILRGTERLLAITFPTETISARAGGETPGAGGWVAPRFGVRVPAIRLAWRGEVGDGAVTTWLMPLPPPRA